MINWPSRLFVSVICIFPPAGIILAHILIAGSAVAGATSPGRPVIVEQPLDMLVVKGDTVTLSCKATGNPQPRIVWYKDGKVLPTSADESDSHRVTLPDGSLFLLQVTQGKSRSDAGTYWCVASNVHGIVESKRAVLKIGHLKEEFRVRPKAVKAVVGSQAVMECAPPRGSPEPTVFWKKDGKVLDLTTDTRRTILSGGGLSISDVQVADSGFYSCMAENVAGTRESNAARLTVHEKPEIITAPRDIAVDVGSDAIFVCTMSGDPNPVVTWQRKNGPMPADRARVLEDNSLRIERVLTSDEDEYQCIGKNPAGKVEASAKLIVQSSPWFVEEPRDTEVREGGEVTLRCEVNGSPPPSQFWSKDGTQELLFPGHISPDHRLVVTEKALTIRQVMASDEAQYTCTALNAAGSNSVKAFLRVSPEQLINHLPPLIVRGPANQTLPTESVVIMPCSVKSSSEDVEIAWLKNSVAVLADGRISTLPGGSLEIRALRKEDTGVYSCAVKGRYGEDQVSAFLQVEVPIKPNVTFERMPEPSTFPSPPGPPQVLNVTDSSVALRWTVPENSGASPITSYSIQYYSPQVGSRWMKALDFIRAPSHVLTMLRPSSAYVFVVRANNNHGTSEPSLFSSVVRTKASSYSLGAADGSVDFDLESARRSLSDVQVVKLREVKALNETAVKLNWKLLRMEIPISGFYVRWQSARLNQQGWVNVSSQGGRMSWSEVVGNLQPFTKYKFFVIPFFRTVEGNPSNIMDATTAEAVPSAPPSDVQVRMTNLTTVRISWKPPPQELVNGNLRGYQVLVIANKTRIQRNITINNEKATGVTLFHLVPGVTYHIRVNAFTAAGIGEVYSENVVTMDEATLRAHLARESMNTAEGRLKALVQEPWFISSIGAALWALLVLAVGVIWWRRRRSYKKNAEGGSPSGPFIKINDGSVLTSAREALWIDPQQFYPMNGSCGTVLLPPFNPRYIVAGSESPRFGHSMNREGRSASMNRQRAIEKPYTELSQLGYGVTGRAPGGSYYHQIPMESGYASSPYYNRASSPPSPTPYATTTLVMSGHRHRMGVHHQQPGLGSANTFGGHRNQDAKFMDGELCNTKERSLKRAGSLMSEHVSGQSPPHTDVSLLSGGNSSGSSANSRRCRPGQPVLLDFLPPPPSQPPPPVVTDQDDAADLSLSQHVMTETNNFLSI